MPQLTASQSGSVYGRTYNDNLSVTTDNGADFAPTVTGGKLGTLTTRTDANTGTLTMEASHGITTGAKVDLHWVENSVAGSRLGMTVGTVAGNSVPIDLGSGVDLPTLNLANITVKVLHEEGAWDIDGDDIQGIVCQAPTYRTAFVFRAADDSELLAIVLPAGSSYLWTSEMGTTNPLAGTTVAKVTLSHAGSGTASQTCPGALLYN